LGEVRNAGSFQFKGKLSILDAIAQAGGFNINANTSSVKIMRAEDSQQKIIEVDLGDVRKGVRGAETVLKANDTIFVEKIGKVIVLGEVNRPGAFELKDKMTALEAIAIGGGFSDMADKNNVKILRIENDQQEMLQVRLVDLGEDIENSEIILKPNDTIYVEKIGKVVVLGEVVRPGTFDLKERTTVLEAIAMAGGFTKIAAINSTRVIRKNAGIKKVMRIKVTDITRKGDKKKDIEVLPGDIIFVPESLF
jgi:polysaccharide export outer membrane protein